MCSWLTRTCVLPGPSSESDTPSCSSSPASAAASWSFKDVALSGRPGDANGPGSSVSATCKLHHGHTLADAQAAAPPRTRSRLLRGWPPQVQHRVRQSSAWPASARDKASSVISGVTVRGARTRPLARQGPPALDPSSADSSPPSPDCSSCRGPVPPVHASVTARSTGPCCFGLTSRIGHYSPPASTFRCPS
jgi:hypothetical protein